MVGIAGRERPLRRLDVRHLDAVHYRFPLLLDLLHGQDDLHAAVQVL